MANKKVRLTLFENGLDFILHSLEHLKHDNNDPRNIKFGVLHLSSGIELILKERLIKEHKSLIFKDLNKFRYSNFQNPEVPTIYLDDIILRLEEFGGVLFDSTSFVLLKKMRNSFEHSAFELELIYCKATISQAIHEILTFIDNYLSYKRSNNVKNQLERIRENLVDFDSFYDEEMIKISSQVKNERSLFYCPICKQYTFSIDKLSCLFCKTKYRTPQETILTYFLKVANIKTRSKKILSLLFYGNCPNCNGENIIDVSRMFKEQSHDLAFLCFDCGHKIKFEEAKKCIECARVLREKDGDLCTLCRLKSSYSVLGSLGLNTQEMVKNLTEPLISFSSFTNRLMESIGGMQSVLLDNFRLADTIGQMEDLQSVISRNLATLSGSVLFDSQALINAYYKNIGLTGSSLNHLHYPKSIDGLEEDNNTEDTENFFGEEDFQ